MKNKTVQHSVKHKHPKSSSKKHVYCVITAAVVRGVVTRNGVIKDVEQSELVCLVAHGAIPPSGSWSNSA